MTETCSARLVGPTPTEEGGEFCGDSRSSHGSPPAVSHFPNVHRSGHCAISVPEEEGNFVDAFASQEGAACNGVTEAVHRRDRTVGNIS